MLASGASWAVFLALSFSLSLSRRIRSVFFGLSAAAAATSLGASGIASPSELALGPLAAPAAGGLYSAGCW